jgi:putative acetyltransferase
MIDIGIENPQKEDVRALIAALNDSLLALTPAEHCYHLSVEQMADTDTTVFIARQNGAAIACGALKRHTGQIGEVKRMYTRPEHQGAGVGGRILERIENLARSEGMGALVLETGDRHPAAWRVYERAGFRRCGPVLDYPDSKWSVFYRKELGMAEASAA